MAQADWKRYYAIVVEDFNGAVRLFPYVAGTLAPYKRRETALDVLGRMREFNGFKPIGIARLRGHANNPELQRWFAEHSQ